MIFDTHCHLDDSRFDEDREAVLDDMQARGFTPCAVVGSDIASSRAVQKLAKTRDFLYFAAGVHPHEATEYTDAIHAELLQMMQDPKCVAWGEIGLDYYYDHSPREVQREVFIRQLEQAAAIQKPVIFHIRDAHGDVLAILKERKHALPQGIIHCFSGSVEQAKLYIKLGFYISLAGPVTFSNARNLHAVAAFVPDDRLLIETDSPYLSPVPVRGQRNDPRNVLHIARQVASLRNTSVEELCARTRKNGMDIFRITEPA